MLHVLKTKDWQRIWKGNTNNNKKNVLEARDHNPSRKSSNQKISFGKVPGNFT